MTSANKTLISAIGGLGAAVGKPVYDLIFSYLSPPCRNAIYTGTESNIPQYCGEYFGTADLFVMIILLFITFAFLNNFLEPIVNGVKKLFE